MNNGVATSVLRIARKLPPELGGQEFHVADLSRQQAATSSAPLYIDFSLGAPVTEPGIACRRVMPGRVVALPSSDVLQAGLFSLGVVLSNLFAPRRRIGIVHVHGDILEIAAAALVAKRYRVPLVATLHAGLSERSWYRMLAARILNYPAAVICVSGDIAGQVRGITRGREWVHTIHSGIHRTLFLGEARQNLQSPVRVVSVGRLHPMKGYQHLVAAASHPTLRDRIIVEIIGDGPEDQHLKALADRTGAPVRFLGRKTKPEIAKILKAADIFVSSSVQLPEQSEGTPTVVMEAMASGLPVVATDIGGARAIVAHGENGLIVAQADPDAIVAALNHFLSEGDAFRRVSHRNLSDSAAFDWVVIGKKIADVYKQAGGRGLMSKDT